MLKRQKGSAAPTASVTLQALNVMQNLVTNSPSRATPAQIAAMAAQIRTNHVVVSSLDDALRSGPHAGSVETLSSKLVNNFSDATKERRQSSKEAVSGEAATNFSRMRFFDEYALKGLCQVFGATGDTLAAIQANTTITSLDQTKLAIAIEALLEAAQFGSGRAIQSLIEANERNIIDLTEDEIRSLVRAQIYWYRESLSDVTLKNWQILPQLIGNKKAWDAVRNDQPLYTDVLVVAYRDSGVACQKLIEANENNIISLASLEVRQLVQNQINQYFAAQVPGATIKVEDQQTPSLTIPSKVWDALMEAPKESWTLLRDFLENLDAELPEELRMTAPDALAKFTENNPMAFKAYFESAAAQAPVDLSTLSDPRLKNHVETRNRVMKALFGLRHAAFKLDNKALLNMRPAIAAKKKENKAADVLASKAILSHEAEMLKKKADVEAQNAKAIAGINAEDALDAAKADIVTFDRRGTMDRLVASAGLLQQQYDRPSADLTADVRRKRQELEQAVASGKHKPDGKTIRTLREDLALYEGRVEKYNAQFAAYEGRKAVRDQQIAQRQQQAEETCAGFDQELQAFNEARESEKQSRDAALKIMKAEEKAFNKTLVENNPMTESVRLLFLAAVQDLAMFGTLTQDWLDELATILKQDLVAINAGEFAVAFTARTLMKSEISEQKFPVHMLANNPAYVALLEIYRRAPAKFRASIQDQLFSENGRVVSVKVSDLLKTEFPLTSNANSEGFEAEVDEGNEYVGSKVSKEEKLERNIKNALKHYTAKGYEDSLLTVLETNMALAYLISIRQVFPHHDAPHTVVLDEASASCARITKLVSRSFDGSPSPLRNYLQMALVVMQDKQALERLSAQDINNPLYNILLTHNAITPNDFSCDMEQRVRDALQDVIDETAITTMAMNKAYTVLAYLDKVLPAGTEVDYLVRACFSAYVAAQFAKGEADKLKVNRPTQMDAYQRKADQTRAQQLTNGMDRPRPAVLFASAPATPRPFDAEEEMAETDVPAPSAPATPPPPPPVSGQKPAAPATPPPPPPVSGQKPAAPAAPATPPPPVSGQKPAAPATPPPFKAEEAAEEEMAANDTPREEGAEEEMAETDVPAPSAPATPRPIDAEEPVEEEMAETDVPAPSAPATPPPPPVSEQKPAAPKVHPMLERRDNSGVSMADSIAARAASLQANKKPGMDIDAKLQADAKQRQEQEAASYDQEIARKKANGEPLTVAEKGRVRALAEEARRKATQGDSSDSDSGFSSGSEDESAATPSKAVPMASSGPAVARPAVSAAVPVSSQGAVPMAMAPSRPAVVPRLVFPAAAPAAASGVDSVAVGVPRQAGKVQMSGAVAAMFGGSRPPAAAAAMNAPTAPIEAASRRQVDAKAPSKGEQKAVVQPGKLGDGAGVGIAGLFGSADPEAAARRARALAMAQQSAAAPGANQG